MSSDAYERAKGGKLTFKGGTLATTSKSIDKKKNKNKNKNKSTINQVGEDEQHLSSSGNTEIGGDSGCAGEVYTIDAAKRLKYEELFPVEAKKFRYKPKSDFKSLEDALDDRVKKKADRYCK